MLLTRAVRPDQLIIAAKTFVASVFGRDFVEKADALLNLGEIVDQEVRSTFDCFFFVCRRFSFLSI